VRDTDVVRVWCAEEREADGGRLGRRSFRATPRRGREGLQAGDEGEDAEPAAEVAGPWALPEPLPPPTELEPIRCGAVREKGAASCRVDVAFRDPWRRNALSFELLP